MQEELTPEDAKASLGLATRLGEEYLLSQVPPQELGGEESQQKQPVQPEQTEEQQINPEMIAQIVRDAVKEELGGIKEEIAKVLEDEDGEKE